MSSYPLIADHGLIGNLQTAALVSTDGTIDWFCAPRFDSPSIFGALLDDDHGGHLRTRPTVDTFTRQQLYYPDTAILVTRFLTESGVGEVVDFMPIASTAVASNRHQLVRMLRCVRGEMTFVVDIAPRFDYGREPHETHVSEDGISSKVPGARCRSASFESRTTLDLRVFSGCPRSPDLRAHPDSRPDARACSGDRSAPPSAQVRVSEAWQLFDETVRFWRSWLVQSTYTGRWRETLERSAITPGSRRARRAVGSSQHQRRHCQSRSGASATGTTGTRGCVMPPSRSMPYSVSDSLRKRRRSGAGWATRVDDQIGGEGGPLNIMYRVDGSSDLIEEILPHWEGISRDPARSALGTVPRTNCSSTSTARRSTVSTSPTSMDWKAATRDGAGSATSWTGSPTTGTSRRRESGRLGAAGRSSRTDG